MSYIRRPRNTRFVLHWPPTALRRDLPPSSKRLQEGGHGHAPQKVKVPQRSASRQDHLGVAGKSKQSKPPPAQQQPVPQNVGRAPEPAIQSVCICTERPLWSVPKCTHPPALSKLRPGGKTDTVPVGCCWDKPQQTCSPANGELSPMRGGISYRAWHMKMTPATTIILQMNCLPPRKMSELRKKKNGGSLRVAISWF